MTRKTRWSIRNWAPRGSCIGKNCLAISEPITATRARASRSASVRYRPRGSRRRLATLRRSGVVPKAWLRVRRERYEISDPTDFSGTT